MTGPGVFSWLPSYIFPLFSHKIFFPSTTGFYLLFLFFFRLLSAPLIHLNILIPYCWLFSSDLVVHSKSLQSCLTLCDPTDHSSPGSSVHGDSPGKNPGVVCHALLQGISLTQGSNSHLIGMKLTSHMSLALAGGFFATGATWEANLEDPVIHIYSFSNCFPI